MRSDHHDHDWEGSADSTPPEEVSAEIARITSLMPSSHDRILHVSVQEQQRRKRRIWAAEARLAPPGDSGMP